MSPILRRLIAPTLLLSLAMASCGDSQGTALRSAFLKELAWDVAWPAYQGFESSTGALLTTLDVLEIEPMEDSLLKAQMQWRRARAAWLRQEAFRIGPAEEQHTSAAVNQVPSITGIDSLLAGDAELTETFIAEQGANRKGLLAMEYLLFDAATIGEGTAGARRRAYLRALGNLLHKDATAVRTAWEPVRGAYVTQLSDAGNDGRAYATQKDAVDTVVNRLIASVEVMEQKLSKPLGFETGGTVRPELEEARRSDNSLADLGNAVLGMERVWLGANGNGGLSKVMAASNKQADATVRGDLAAVRSALEAIPPPLRTALTNDRESVEAARAALSTLRATLASEVVSNLGVTLKFNDNDGD
ncbi:imelysin family protein [Archangium gephyra]|nr:imelysin family protein [Archangium gephyra]